MEIKHIKELMAAMGRTRTKSIKLKKEGFELEIECQDNGSYRVVEPSTGSYEESLLGQENSHQAALLFSRSRESHSASNAPLAPAEAVEDTSAKFVTSPMVGTFYASPSPEDPPFIKVGDRVEKHTVVCIIEAMKVMNEVKAGASGVITELLTDNGHPVEFGTKLFKIS